MTQVSVSALAQAPQMFTRSDSGAARNSDLNSATAPVEASAVTTAAPVAASDTVNISPLSRQAVNEAKKEEQLTDEMKREKARKEAATKNAGADSETEKASGAISKVQFVYDLKGDLSVRYLDTSSRLVYQVPSELMIRLKEAAAKSDTSINTKV